MSGCNGAHKMASSPNDEAQPSSLVSHWRNDNSGSPFQAFTYTTIRGDGAIAVMDKVLNRPDVLSLFIRWYRDSHVRSYIRIQGHSWHAVEWYDTDQNPVIRNERRQDFDIKADLLARGLGETVMAQDHTALYRKKLWHTTARPDSTGKTDLKTLQGWCERFCNSRAPIRAFRVSRRLTGIDRDAMTSGICLNIHTSGYRGNVTVSYESEIEKLDIYNDSLINRLRKSPLRWLIYLSFFWIITWPAIHFSTQYWDVCTVEQEVSPAIDSIAMSEEDWVHKCKKVLMQLVKAGFKGDAKLQFEGYRDPSRHNRSVPEE